MMQPRHFLAVATAVWSLAAGFGPGLSFAQDVLQKQAAIPKLIGQADLDCSFFLMESAPMLRITAPFVSGERTILTDSDLFYANPVPGVEAFLEGSLWSILEWGSAVRGGYPSGLLGNVVFLRGRARVVRIESGRAVMKIEKSCGLIEAGYLLVPFRGGDILVGSELDYQVPFRTEGALTGRIVFLETDWTQITARGHWAVIDLGEAHGLKPGMQLNVFRREGKEAPFAVGNTVVVWTGGRWATVKILNSKDAVHLGDLVQVKPAL